MFVPSDSSVDVYEGSEVPVPSVCRPWTDMLTVALLFIRWAIGVQSGVAIVSGVQYMFLLQPASCWFISWRMYSKMLFAMSSALYCLFVLAICSYVVIEWRNIIAPNPASSMKIIRAIMAIKPLLLVFMWFVMWIERLFLFLHVKCVYGGSIRGDFEGGNVKWGFVFFDILP